MSSGRWIRVSFGFTEGRGESIVGKKDDTYVKIPLGETGYEGFRNFLDRLVSEEVYYASKSSYGHVFATALACNKSYPVVLSYRCGYSVGAEQRGKLPPRR